MSGQSSPGPRRKRADRSEMPLSFLPLTNPRARYAYISALVGLVPVLGLVMGPVAMLFGWLGVRYAKGLPNKDGLGHSVVSIILGFLEFAAAAGGLWLLGRSQEWWG
jgi:hypothetical protein